MRTAPHFEGFSEISYWFIRQSFSARPLEEEVDKPVEDEMEIYSLAKGTVVAANITLAQQRPVSETFDNEQVFSCGGVMDEEKPWLAEPNLKCIKSMSDYLSFKKMEASISLELAKIAYNSFKNELHKIRSELASKDFSFGLDAAGDIQVIDTHGSLSGEERMWLTERLNQYRELKVHVTDHFTASLLLAKYDETGFSARYKFENPDPARMIDYGRVLESDNMEQTWKSQIIERAEKAIPFISERI